MHTGRHYSLKDLAMWTRRETGVLLLVAAVPTLLFQLAGWKWLILPWLPIALIGTAVAFVTGFKNSASYGRLTEARAIWGGIVNSSRAWAFLVLSLPDAPVRTRLIHRHIAWLTALRFQLREARGWENMTRKSNAEFSRLYRVEEWTAKLEDELLPLLGPAESAKAMARKSRALFLLEQQAADLRALAAGGSLSELRHIEMEQLLATLLDVQGKCERIKNSPYPRQFATANRCFIRLFIALTPFGLIQEFQRLGNAYVWVAIPAGLVVSWVFHTMDKIGESSENPFEGSPNDVPITALSRNIEIDLRGMLGEDPLPPPVQPVNQILM
jgi:ion channel-forming bestrophin family protein